MQRLSFILGVTMFVVAATLAISITLREPTDSKVAERKRPSSSPSAVSSQQPRAATSRDSAPSKLDARRESSPVRFSVRAPNTHPQSALLAEKAHKVEAESRAHLERLTAQLELSGEQRRRLFPILARTSQHYDPDLIIAGLQVGSSALTGTAGNRELNDVLDPPQRDQLIEDAMADQALWEDIIDTLRHRLDEETPQIPAESPPTGETAAPKPRGRGNLLDALTPER